LLFLCCFRFVNGYNFNRLLCCLCFLPACQLRRCKVLCIVGNYTGTTNHMVGRNGYLHFKVSKGESELSTAGELVVLPSLEVTINAEAGIPLRHCKQVVAILGEKFITTTAAHS